MNIDINAYIQYYDHALFYDYHNGNWFTIHSQSATSRQSVASLRNVTGLVPKPYTSLLGLEDLFGNAFSSVFRYHLAVCM